MSAVPESGSNSNPLRVAREQLEHAEALRQQRKFDRAESICTGLVRRHPDYFAAQHTLGLIYADKGDYRRAAIHLGQATLINPRSWISLTALAGVYVQLGSPDMASYILERARALKPNEPTILATLGEIYTEEREYEKARDTFAEALKLEPGMLEAGLGMARADSFLGRYAQAATTLTGLWDRGQRILEISAALAALPQSATGRDELSDLDKVARDATETQADFEIELGFVRAALLDRQGRHAEAWQDALAANRAIAAKVKKELAGEVAQRQLSLATARGQASRIVPAPTDQSQPISLFILGPSRSGKTSLESMVSSYDGVRRGYENPALENAISRTYQEAGLIDTHSLTHMPPQFYPQLRQFYGEELQRRAGSARVFTNTHPGYIDEAALVAAIVPNARFVFVKRNLDDVAWRIFMRRYRRGNPHSYDLKSAREYVEWYHAMIDALVPRLGDIARVVHYEQMVADPAAAAAQAAELCGLAAGAQPLPPIGDDRGCAAAYREFFGAVLG